MDPQLDHQLCEKYPDIFVHRHDPKSPMSDGSPFMNKQPFFHRAVILFTATEALTRHDLEDLIDKRKLGPIILNTLEVEEIDAEPGDPADLL
mgnify:CR=1 FL=1